MIVKTAFDVDGKRVETVEKWIDGMELDLPALTQFILPVKVKMILVWWKSICFFACLSKYLQKSRKGHCIFGKK